MSYKLTGFFVGVLTVSSFTYKIRNNFYDSEKRMLSMVERINSKHVIQKSKDAIKNDNLMENFKETWNYEVTKFAQKISEIDSTKLFLFSKKMIEVFCILIHNFINERK